MKTVLGASGRFDGDAVLDIILARPETSRFVVAKLWREFVSPEPDPNEVERIAQRFRGSGYDIEAALRALFLAPAFWSMDHRGTLVKSPVELVAGTLRQLDVAPAAALPFAVAAAGMGQNLFSPPNVKGWPGGEAWIDSNTLLARKQFLDRLARALRNVDFNAARWVSKQPGATPVEKMRSARVLMLPVDAVMADAPSADAQAQAFVRATLLDPAYQLK